MTTLEAQAIVVRSCGPRGSLMSHNRTARSPLTVARVPLSGLKAAGLMTDRLESVNVAVSWGCDGSARFHRRV